VGGTPHGGLGGPWYTPQVVWGVWDGLAGRGYSEDEIEKIMGRNLYRLYEEVIG